jgi:cell division protein ZapA
MAEVTITINQRQYGITCDDGQERRVRDLALVVDERVRAIARSGAATNESHLLVLSALMLADEAYDLRTHISGLEQEISLIAQAQAESSDSVDTDPALDEELITQTIEQLAERIDMIAKRLQTA